MKQNFLLVPLIVAALALSAAMTAVAKPPPDKGSVPGVMSFVAAPYSVGEGAGHVTVTVQRTTALGEVTGKGKTSVDIATSDGTATAGSDYTAVAATLTFARGETQASLDVPILEDTAVEGSQSFTVTLSNAKGRYNLPEPTATVTITDNDTAGPLLVNGSFEASGTFGSPGFGWVIRRPLGGAEPQPRLSTIALGGNSPHDGTYIAQMGGTFEGAADSQISQNITVPSTGTTTLTWWWQMSCHVLGGVGASYALKYPVPESGAPVTLWSRCDSWWSTWTQETVDLTPYAGTTIKIVFGTVGQYSSNTLWVDDVAITNTP